MRTPRDPSDRYRPTRWWLLGLTAVLTLVHAGAGAPPAVPAHIQEANRKVEAQAAARKAAVLQAEQNEVARLTTNLERARVEFGNQLQFLNGLQHDLQSNLAAAQTAKNKGEIENTEAQIANVQSAIRAKTNEVVANERRMQLEIDKAQATPRAQEEARRVAEAKEQASRVATMEKQLEVGQAAFEAQLKSIDAAIRNRTGAGDTAGAQQLEADRKKVIDAQQAWTTASQATLENFKDDLRRSYTQNRNDGIGPTSTTGLRSSLRREATQNGTDPERATDLVDYGAVFGDVDPATGVRTGGTAASAAAMAAGAPRASTQVSIFNEVNSESLLAFVGDVARESTVTYGSWEGFKNRVLKGYVAGVGEGVWDVFKDLVNLVVELGDLTGEALEQRIEKMTGAELDVFGDENLQKMRDLLESADKLITNEDGAGLEEARRIVAVADAVKRVMTRKAEQMAASGEKGLQESLKLAGWGAANVLVDPLAAAKVPGVIGRVITGADKATDAARAGARVAGVAGDAGTAGRVADAATEAGGVGRAAERVATGSEVCKPPGRAVRPGALDTATQVRRRAAAKGSNIVGSHAEVLSDVAKNRNEVILVRPVNQHSTGLIADNFATKGMGIKGKSSDWGPHAGTIPVDPKYSKLGNPTGTPPTPDELKVFENYNKKALGQAYEEPLKDAAGNITGWKPHKADPSHAIAIEVEVPGPDGSPIKVLGDPATGKPITADYDLFAVGGERGPGAVMSGHREMGSISGGEIATADAINSGVKSAGYEGGNVVHHGPANRFENKLSPKSDFPITAFTPDGNVHTLTSAEDLNDFYNTWNKLGYNLEAMPGWGLDPNLPPTGKFGPLGQDPSWIERARAAGVALGRDLSDQLGDFVDVVTGAAAERARVATLNLGDEVVPDCEDPVADGAAPEIEFIDPETTTGAATGTRPTTGSGAGAGSSAGTTAVAVGGGAGFPTVEPIFFDFGGESKVAEDPDSFAAVGRFFGEIFSVEVEQVFNVTGNNPFDPRDPLAEQAGSSPTIVVPTVPDTPSSNGDPVANPGGNPGSSPPAGNPFQSSVGNFSGNNGCGVSLTTFATQGLNAITLTLPGNGTVPFSINGNQANSQSTNLVIFSLPGHSCSAQNIQPTNFQLFCSNSGGGSCLENFSR